MSDTMKFMRRPVEHQADFGDHVAFEVRDGEAHVEGMSAALWKDLYRLADGYYWGDRLSGDVVGPFADWEVCKSDAEKLIH
jgi:hypothetical protein